MKTILRRYALANLILLIAAAPSLPAADGKPDYHLSASPGNVVWGYFAAETKPVLTVKSGQIVEIDTVGLFGMSKEKPEQFFLDHGISLDQPKIKDLIAIKKSVTSSSPGHVMTGPIYVEGAEPGDTLEVRFLDVKASVPYSINSGGPGRGGVPDAVPRPYAKYIPLDLTRNVAVFSDNITVPLQSFQGVMAVAPTPDRGRLPSGPPYADIGGNFDNKDIGKGCTAYFPVQIPGALFHIGDPHAVQGNGEVSTSAAESCTTVTIQFILRKDLHIKAVRAETPTHYMLLGLDTELSVAMRKAIHETIDFLKETQGLDFFDALALSSIAVDYQITQVVDGTKGIHAMIPKNIFTNKPDASYWYNGPAKPQAK